MQRKIYEFQPAKKGQAQQNFKFLAFFAFQSLWNVSFTEIILVFFDTDQFPQQIQRRCLFYRPLSPDQDIQLKRLFQNR